jgi:hypothetical protein
MKTLKLALALIAFLVTATVWPPPRPADAAQSAKCYEHSRD